MTSAFNRIVDRLNLHEALTNGTKPNDLLPPRPEDQVSGEVGKRFTEALRRDLERGRYDPARGYFVAVPKSISSTRPAALLPLADRVVYEAVVATLRPRIETFLLGKGVVFWPRGQECDKRWQDFEHSPLSGDAPYIVVGDISGFYESVSHDRLTEKLVSGTGRREEAEALHQFLTRTMGAERGLPQGLEPSDPLATAYLAEVDFEMIRAGYQYSRHGDDIRIGVSTFDEGRHAIFVLESTLRRAGLLMNNGKTKVLRRKTYERELSSIEATIEDTKLRLLKAKVGAIKRNQARLAEALETAQLEQLGWDFFYHGRVSLQDVIDELSPTLRPGDVDVAAKLFLDTIKRRPGRQGELSPEEFHQRLVGSIVRLAAAKSAAGLRHIGELLVSFPDKTEVLCHYLAALTKTNARLVVRQVEPVFADGRFRTEWETAWAVRVLGGAARDVPADLVKQLTEMMRAPHGCWLAAVEVAKLLAFRGELSRHDLLSLWNTCPEVFRADLILASGLLAPQQEWAQTFLSASKDNPIHVVVCRHLEKQMV